MREIGLEVFEDEIGNMRGRIGKPPYLILGSHIDTVIDAGIYDGCYGVLAGLGFPYERLCEINPGVIYVSNSGFGHTGPYAPRPGYDTWISFRGQGLITDPVFWENGRGASVLVATGVALVVTQRRLLTENLDETLERLAGHGIEPERPPYQVSEGGSRICFVRDPDGYRIELIEKS